MYIPQVGIQNLDMTLKMRSKYFSVGRNYIPIQSKVSIQVDLDKDTKGISMSRFVILMAKWVDCCLTHISIQDMLVEISKILESKNSFIRFDFLYPIYINPPKSGQIPFPLFYPCKFEGQLINNKFYFYEGVNVQYASYCPCSAELSKDLEEKGLNGFPHAQRCVAELNTKIDISYQVWLEDLIELIEQAVVIVPFPIIKRVDEQEIARRAAENPMFVEDAIRNISQALNTKKEVVDWIIKCTHEESIHKSEAISINWKGVDGGFGSDNYFIK